MEENQVEQTAESNAEVQETEQKPVENTFTQDQVTEIVKKRLAQERSQMYKKLGVDDIDIAVTAVKTQKDLEEKQKIQKGEFEEILKNKTQEWNKEKASLESQLVDIKVNKSLLSSASKNKAINPDQVVSLLQFLTQNPHFVSATPSGSGTVSNVDRQELNKPLNIGELDMNNPEDKKKYAEWRKHRDSKPRVINANQ